MRIAVRILALSVVTILRVGTAEAKGCIKGAIIGGIAGHYLAERGVVGAVVGCLAGRGLVNRRARREIDFDSSVQRGGVR